MDLVDVGQQMSILSVLEGELELSGIVEDARVAHREVGEVGLEEVVLPQRGARPAGELDQNQTYERGDGEGPGGEYARDPPRLAHGRCWWWRWWWRYCRCCLRAGSERAEGREVCERERKADGAVVLWVRRAAAFSMGTEMRMQ